MSPTLYALLHSRSTRVWTGFVIAFFLYSTVTFISDAGRPARERAWLINREIHNRFRRIRAGSASRYELQYNDGEPFAHFKDIGQGEYITDLPATVLDRRYAGYHLRFRIDNNFAQPAELISPPNVPPTAHTQTWDIMQWMRRPLMAVGFTVWLCCAALMAFAGDWHRSVAQVSLGCALVSMIAWMLPPAIHLFLGSTPLPFFPFVVAVMLLASIIATAWPGRKRRERGHRACEGCGYDLFGNESGICSECGKAIPPPVVKVVAPKVLETAAALSDLLTAPQKACYTDLITSPEDAASAEASEQLVDQSEQ